MDKKKIEEVYAKWIDYKAECRNKDISSGSFYTWLDTQPETPEDPPAKITRDWFKPSHRPPYNKGHHLNFSISVLLYSPKMETHTVGWFDFELDKWSYEAGEEYTDFVWTNLPTP